MSYTDDKQCPNGCDHPDHEHIVNLYGQVFCGFHSCDCKGWWDKTYDKCHAEYVDHGIKAYHLTDNIILNA